MRTYWLSIIGCQVSNSLLRGWSQVRAVRPWTGQRIAAPSANAKFTDTLHRERITTSVTRSPADLLACGLHSLASNFPSRPRIPTNNHRFQTRCWRAAACPAFRLSRDNWGSQKLDIGLLKPYWVCFIIRISSNAHYSRCFGWCLWYEVVTIAPLYNPPIPKSAPLSNKPQEHNPKLKNSCKS